MVGWFPWNAICELFRTSWQMGKRRNERRFGESLNGPVKAPPVWPDHFTWNVARLCMIAGRTWKGDVLVADTEEWENMDASDSYPRRLNTKYIRTESRCLNELMSTDEVLLFLIS